jgi:6-phosphogluconolactonase
MKNPLVYVSSHESGDISAYEMAMDSGRLTPLPRVVASKLVMPLAVSPDGLFVHAAVRAEPFGLLTYAIDHSTGALKHIRSAPLPASMVGIMVDRTGRWLLAAAYGADALYVFAIDADGSIDALPAYQAASGGVKPHAICQDSTNRFVYVPHLGTDEVRIYAFDATKGALAPSAQESVKLKAGAGPRHMVLSKDERFLYVLGQLDGSVTVFKRDADSGDLDQIQSIDSLPPGSGLLPGKPRPPSGSLHAAPPETDVVWCADIQITPQGHFLYTTERTMSTISIFAIDTATGRLRVAGHVETEKQPRAIGIDPAGRFLIASGEVSQQLSLYQIDSDTGALTLVETALTGSGANWVLFVASRDARMKRVQQLEVSAA